MTGRPVDPVVDRGTATELAAVAARAATAVRSDVVREIRGAAAGVAQQDAGR